MLPSENGGTRVSSDTKAIIGTIVAVAVSLGGLFAGLLSVQFSTIDVRFDEVNVRIDDLRADLTAESATVKTDLSADIATVKTDLSADIATAKTDLSADFATLRDDVRGVNDRLRAVEIALGRVDQRLATLERLHLPSADGGE